MKVTNTEVSAQKVTVCIPTYWTANSGFPVEDKLTNIYDHPTPINSTGTLERALMSLSNAEGNFNVVIIGTITEPELQNEFQTKLKKSLSTFKDLDIYYFSYNELHLFHKWLEENDKAYQKKYLNLEGYSNIRNLCLILPHILKSDLAFLVDDDEVVTDKKIIEKATDFLFQKIDDEIVLGKGGLYVTSEEGGQDSKFSFSDYFWPKVKTMKQALSTIDAGPRIAEAAFVLGGAMVVHRELFTKVSFDPWILRGEDIDYLINCKLHGYNFFMDKEFQILHLPPKELYSKVLVMRQDIYRFTYEKEKLDYAFNHTDLKNFPVEDLDPYPGKFLRKNVNWKALGASLCQGVGKEQMRNCKTAISDAARYSRKNKSRWFGFQRLWPTFMEEIAGIDASKVLTKI